MLACPNGTGLTYYYLREVAWVGGRPKIVSQRRAEALSLRDSGPRLANRTRAPNDRGAAVARQASLCATPARREHQLQSFR
jgi:hypothetical protein